LLLLLLLLIVISIVVTGAMGVGHPICHELSRSLFENVNIVIVDVYYGVVVVVARRIHHGER